MPLTSEDWQASCSHVRLQSSICDIRWREADRKVTLSNVSEQETREESWSFLVLLHSNTSDKKSGDKQICVIYLILLSNDWLHEQKMLGIWMVLTSLIKLVFLNWSTIFSSRLTALWKLTCYWETAIFTTPVLPFCWHGKEIKAKFIKCCSRVNPYWLFLTLYPFSGRAGQYICLHIFVSIRDRKFGIFWKWPIYIWCTTG